MDVAAAGTGSPGQVEAIARPLPGAGHVSARGGSRDGVSHSLQSLANPHIGELLGRIEQARNAHGPQVLEGLLRTAVSAANGHDVQRALAVITEMVRVHPEHAVRLVQGEAALAPMRGEANHLFEQLTSAAKSEAVQTLAAAASMVGTRDVSALDVLAAAQRFADSGTLINYIRATEMGQTLLSSYSGPLNPRRGLTLLRLRAMWRRVPVLLLLAGWLLLGLAGWVLGIGGVEFWATGFLVLVGVQFLTTIRNIRF